MNMHQEEHELIKQSVMEALLALMDVKPFSEITITELVSKAGIARSTYYRNYSSKEEIIAERIDDVLRDFYNEFPAHSMDERTEYEHLQLCNALQRSAAHTAQIGTVVAVSERYEQVFFLNAE